MPQMNDITVLIVDDDRDIRDLLTIMLRNQNLASITANDGIEALEKLRNNKIDLIILDIMMPRMDGLMACMKIRENLDIPIIILSAKIEDSDKILGLTLGADDYVSKPFNPMLLIARVRAQLRRYNNFNTTPSSSSIIIKDLKIDLNRHEVSINNTVIKLTPHEFDILLLLCKNKNNVLSIEQIYENVWEEPYVQFDRTVTVHIRRLRGKLQGDYIKTIWGVGYKIED
jgi:DNA-binding response OmpR family regulator